MALSQAILGIGTELRLGDGASSEVFTKLPEIKNISFGGITAEEVDTTHMDSPDFYREFKATLKDSGDITMESHYLPSNSTQQSLKTVFEARTVANWELETPDGEALFSFSGHVSNFTPGQFAVDNVIPLTFSIRISGPVVITIPAP